MKISVFSKAIIAIIVLAIILFAVPLLKGVKYSNTAGGGVTTTVTPVQSTQISKLKNITYEYLYKAGAKSPYATVKMIGISNISSNASSKTVYPGKLFSVRMLYHGYFGFNSVTYNSTAFLKNTMDLYYFGYREAGAHNLLVYDNVNNVSSYFALKNTSMSSPPGLNPVNYLMETAYLEPTANASGKSWEFCGGIFITYLNNTDGGQVFGALSYNGTYVYNSSLLNFVSNNCTSVDVA